MSELLSQQSWLYEDTANQLVTLARHQLLMAWSDPLTPPYPLSSFTPPPPPSLSLSQYA